MKAIPRILLTIVFVILSFFLTVYPTQAQSDYPKKPIEVIIPYSPGGASDFTMRYFAERWGEFLGQPVVAVNKPGGMTAIGARMVANAKPDGYTLFTITDTSVTSKAMINNPGYDVDSFKYFFLISRVPVFLNVKSDSPWKTLNDFLSDTKLKPGKLRYAASNGAPSHYDVMMLENATGAELSFVPFTSTPQCLSALLGNHVELAATMGLAGMSGTPLIRTLATTVKMSKYPNVPTLKEFGAINIDASIGLCGPKGVPDAIVKKFTDAHRKVMAKYEKEIAENLAKFDQAFSFIDGQALHKLFRDREKIYREFSPKQGTKGK